MPLFIQTRHDRLSRNPLFYTLPRFRTSVQSYSRAIALIGLLLLCGCKASGNDQGAPPPPDAPRHSRTYSITASPKRLADDTYRAFHELGWGGLRKQVQILQSAATDQGDPPPTVSVQGLMPNGKTAHLWAWPVEGEVLETKDDVVDFEVSVRIGHFGHPDIEADLIDRVRAFLRGPAKREYGGSFELPPFPGTE